MGTEGSLQSGEICMPRSSAPPHSGGAGSALKLIKSWRSLDVSPKSLKAV